jgi:Flp pilus assembly secretin CpaC
MIQIPIGVTVVRVSANLTQILSTTGVSRVATSEGLTMSKNISVHFHGSESYGEIYAALAQLFSEDSKNKTHWVTFDAEGTQIVFFAPPKEQE